MMAQYGGTDYSSSSSSYLVWKSFQDKWSDIPAGSRNEYFFVLPLGGYINGSLIGMIPKNGTAYGEYWASTPFAGSNNIAWMMHCIFYYDAEGQFYSAYWWPNSTYSSSDSPFGGKQAMRDIALPKWADTSY